MWGTDETLTLTGDDWSTGGYDAATSNTTGTKTTSGSTSIGLSWAKTYKNAGIQMKASTGEVHSTSYPTTNNIIKSITVDFKTNTAYAYGSVSNNPYDWEEIDIEDNTAANVQSEGYKYFKVTSTGSYCVLNTITVVYTAAASTPHTITFNAGGGSCNTASSGSVTSYTLPAASPSASCALEGWVFAGWKESSAQSSASAPASKLWQAGETYSPAADITLYAVYFQASGNNYEYIDNLNSLFDGAKMIITAYNSGDYAVSNTTDGDGYIYSSTVSPDGDDVISSPANSIVWTLKGYKDNWTLKNVGNNKYIKVSTRPALADVSETFSITYEVDEDDYDQFNIQKGSKYLYMWNDNTFSGYNKTYLYFYQQQGTYITNPSCCTPLGSINGSVL